MAEKRASDRELARPLIRNRVLDTIADIPDIRDQIYKPTLRTLLPQLKPFEGERPAWWSDQRVRDQGRMPSCVGHALAAVIDHMRAAALVEIISKDSPQFETLDKPWASARMLYNLARYHDEWLGEEYGGSSIRGGLKGFFYNGACSTLVEEDQKANSTPSIDYGIDWFMTKRLTEEARTIQLGAYYRVRPRLVDMHSALNETNALLVSATTHDGWFRISPDTHTIAFQPGAKPAEGTHAMHAFAIIGYDEEGFWIQNSWGKAWGKGGFARWTYEDWAANVADAWVLRLAVLDPDGKPSLRARPLAAYGNNIDRSETHFLSKEVSPSVGPSRLEVLGHLVPFRDGRLDRYGPYNVNRQTLRETFQLIRQRYADGHSPDGSQFAPDGVTLTAEQRRYHHVLMYFLGGWSDEARLAQELANVIPVFKRLGIYPFFVSWDTPVFAELERIVRFGINLVASQTASIAAFHRWTRDRSVEGHVALTGNRLLRDLRCSARRMFRFDQPDPDAPATEQKEGEGAIALARLFEAMLPYYRDGSLSYHFVAHGFGAQVLIECLAQQDAFSVLSDIASCTLISPLIASHRLTDRRQPDTFNMFDCLLGKPRGRRRRPEHIGIERLRLIGLSEHALRTDRFSDNYGLSWPELWANVRGRDDIADTAATRTEMRADNATGLPCRSLPLLALPHEMQTFATACIKAKCDVQAYFATSCDDDADASLHHELGFHQRVLDMIAGGILRTDCSGVFASGGRKIEFDENPAARK